MALRSVTALALLLLASTPAFAQQDPTRDSIRAYVDASEGYAKATGRREQSPGRQPIDPESWERLDFELRAVINHDNAKNWLSTDPNQRPQYAIMTFQAKTDLYVEVRKIGKTKVVRRSVKAGDTMVLVAQVVPEKVKDTWTFTIDWQNALPSGLPAKAFTNTVLEGNPDELALREEQKRREDEAAAKTAAKAKQHFDAIAQGLEEKRLADAKIAAQNAQSAGHLKQALTPLIGKWLPYTIIKIDEAGNPNSDFRALKIERMSDMKGTAILLNGSEPSSPQTQVTYGIENGALRFRDGPCDAVTRPGLDNGRVYMISGHRTCDDESDQIAIIPEERKLTELKPEITPTAGEAPPVNGIAISEQRSVAPPVAAPTRATTPGKTPR